jgi:hypothetical protein
MRDALDVLFDQDQLSWAIPATNTLVEVLLARHADGDVASRGRYRSAGGRAGR